MVKMQDNKINLLAIFGAFCLFLSAVEYLIPKPLPFLRLGLANLPLLLALDFKFSFFIYLVLTKIFAQAILGGMLFSYVFLFSFAGTVASALTMFFLRRAFPKKTLSFIGISIAGAFVSNIMQLLLSYFFILGKSTIYFAPPFLACGIITGAALGVFVNLFCASSLWYKNLWNLNMEDTAGIDDVHDDLLSVENKFLPAHLVKKKDMRDMFPAYDLFVAAIIFTVMLLLNNSTTGLLIQFLIFWSYAALCKKSFKPLFTIMFFLSITLINLYPPNGKVLFEIAGFRITGGALDNAIRKACVIESLVMISKATIKTDLNLPGTFGLIIKKSFFVLEKISLLKKNVRVSHFRTHFIKDIDNLILTITKEQQLEVLNTDAEKTKTKRSVKSVLILAAAVFFAAVPIFF